MIKIFPFDIAYRKILNKKYDCFSNKFIISYFITDFYDSGAKYIHRENENKIVTEIPFFNFRPAWNLNRWVGIDSCSLEIQESKTNNIRTVVYRFNMTKLLLIGLFVAIFLWGISQDWRTGFIAFGVFGIFIWLIKLLQHSLSFYNAFTNMLYERKNQQKIENENDQINTGL